MPESKKDLDEIWVSLNGPAKITDKNNIFAILADLGSTSFKCYYKEVDTRFLMHYR